MILTAQFPLSGDLFEGMAVWSVENIGESLTSSRYSNDMEYYLHIVFKNMQSYRYRFESVDEHLQVIIQDLFKQITKVWYNVTKIDISNATSDASRVILWNKNKESVNGRLPIVRATIILNSDSHSSRKLYRQFKLFDIPSGIAIDSPDESNVKVSYSQDNE